MIRPDIIPAKTLVFEYGSSGPIISQLKILNHSTIDKRFKIRTTKPQFYLTSPSEGIVSDEIYISIEMKCDKFMLEHRLKDKFQVLIMDVNLYEQSQDWEKAPDKFILDISFMKKEEFSDSHIYQADSIIEKPIEQSVSERKLDALQKKFKEQAKLIVQQDIFRNNINLTQMNFKMRQRRMSSYILNRIKRQMKMSQFRVLKIRQAYLFSKCQQQQLWLQYLDHYQIDEQRIHKKKFNKLYNSFQSKKKSTRKKGSCRRAQNFITVSTHNQFLSILKALLGLGDYKLDKSSRVIQRPTYEQRATQTSPTSTPIKKVKCFTSQETTRNLQDLQNLQDLEDLYCYEYDKTVQMPCLKPQYEVDKSYIHKYQDYNENIRAIVISKIIDNCETCHIDYGHIAIELFDRFLSRRPNKVVYQGELRLLSLACILLAGKISKLPPRIQDILKLSTVKFTREQLLKCEQQIIRVLDWNLNPITLKDFLDEALIRYQNFYHDHQRKIYLDTTDLYRIVNVVTLDYKYLSYNRADLAFSIILEYYGNNGEEFINQYGLTTSKLLQTRCYIQPIVKLVKLKKDTHVFELWKIIN